MNELITTRPVVILTDGFCRQCGCTLVPRDNFCSNCGAGCRDLDPTGKPTACAAVAETDVTHQTAVAVNHGLPTMNAILNNRLAVVGIILLIGPLGLPALWFSPRFGSRTKIFTTVAYVLLTTIVPIAIAWYWLDFSLRPLLEAISHSD